MRAQEVSAFCTQVSLLQGAAISLDGGLSIMAEDAADEKSKAMLNGMSQDVELGDSLSAAMERTGEFPKYVIKMAQIGQETGTMEVVMRSLAAYYDREDSFAKTLKNAVTYPVVMVLMLLLVIFVLLTQVMPVFEGVYEQLGAQVSPITKSAVQIGSIVSGGVLILALILIFVVLGVTLLWKRGRKVRFAESLVTLVKSRSHIAASVAKRRISAVLSLSMKSGLDMDRGIDLALELVEQKSILTQLQVCKTALYSGDTVYTAFKKVNLFSGMDLQMIKVGSRAGQLDVVLGELAEKYEREVDDTIEQAIGRFEPTMVVIMAISVGLILLSVMMPLVRIMAAIG